MSKEMDEFVVSKTRLADARKRLKEFSEAISEIQNNLLTWQRISPGEANTIMIPSFTKIPSVLQLQGAAAEFNTALQVEFNAFRKMSVAEQGAVIRYARSSC
jgi:hypothetical protein